MNEPRTNVDELLPGRKVWIQADAFGGRFSINGVVADVGSYAFRVKCKRPVSPDELDGGQDVRVTLNNKKGILPVTTQFVRVVRDDPNVIILRLPSGKWQKNRRGFYRGDIELPAIVIKSDGSRIDAATINISGSGALVAANVFFKPGDEIQLILKIEGKENLGVKVRIVWGNYEKDPKRYGVKFLDIKPRAQNIICRMVMVMEFEQRRAAIRELNERTASR